MSLTFRWAQMDLLELDKPDPKIKKVIEEEILPVLRNTTDLRIIAAALATNNNLEDLISATQRGFVSRGRALKSAKRGAEAFKKAKMAIRAKEDDAKIYKLLTFARRHCASHEEEIAQYIAKHNPYKSTPPTAPKLESTETRAQVHPHLSHKVTVAAGNSGRRIVADTHISVGEPLIVEPAFTFVIQPGYEMFFCDACGLKISKFLPCSTCSEVVYCNETCRAKVSTVHEKECGYVGRFAKQGYISRLLLKVLLTNDPQQLGLYASVANHHKFLRYNKTKTTKQLVEIGCFAMGVMHFLNCTAKYYEKKTKEQMVLAVYQLLVLQLQIFANAQALDWYYADPIRAADYNEVYSRIRLSNKLQVGLGVFLVASTINHSCDPNIHFRFSGSQLIGVATTPMEKGDEVLFCWGAHYKLMRRSFRRTYLKARLGIGCHCLPCRLDYDHTSIFHAYRCSECDGPSVPNPTLARATCCRCPFTMDVTHEMKTILFETNKFNETKMSKLEVPTIVLIATWHRWRLVLYRSHHDLIRLTQCIRNRFIRCRQWFFATEVSRLLISALEERYAYPCPDKIMEMRLGALNAQFAASELTDDAIEEDLQFLTTRFGSVAAKEQAILCGTNELEMDTAPLFLESQFPS